MNHLDNSLCFKRGYWALKVEGIDVRVNEYIFRTRNNTGINSQTAFRAFMTIAPLLKPESFFQVRDKQFLSKIRGVHQAIRAT